MKYLVYCLLFSTLLIACNTKNAKPTPFEREGVSLNCPSGWIITDQDSLEGEGFSFNIEKEGFFSSGLLMMFGSMIPFLQIYS